MNSFQLKIIAIITMLMDHIYTYMVRIYDIPIWFGYLGKLASPIFFYLIVEGFFHTRSKMKYLGRLTAFGIFMMGVDKIVGIHNNIFLSLALSIAILMVIDYARKTKNAKTYIIATVFVIALSGAYLFTEASIFGLGMTFIFYFFREKKVLMSIAYCVMPILQLISMISIPGINIYDQIFIFEYQWMMIFALPLILMYNGKLGLKNTFTKWMFYIFYPLHLIIIQVVCKLVA